MDNLIDATIDALNRIKLFSSDIISISDLYSNKANIHMMSDAFFEHFSNYKATYRDCNSYPIELSVTYNGVKFFALYSVEDFHHAN